MSNHSSPLVLKRVVSHQVWQKLTSLWLAMADDDGTVLFTEDTLSKLLNNDYKIHLSQQLEINKFFLLITPEFNAFLQQERSLLEEAFKISVVFEPSVIIKELIKLSYQQQWNSEVIGRLKAKVFSKLTQSKDGSWEFIFQVITLLTSDTKTTQFDDLPSSPHSSMEKLLHYPVEQERIFEQIKLQISQDRHLSEIIQTTIERCCSCLGLDRLLIFQFDVPLEPVHQKSWQSKVTDTITYEALGNEQVSSLLYFQETTCWQKSPGCRNKYHQGFSLVINEVETGSNLNPCLKSLMAKFQVKAKIVTPINVRGKLWGLIIAHQTCPREWHHQDVQFLRQIAEYIGIAIYNCQSYQQLQQQKLLLEKQVQVQAQQLKDALIAAEAASKSKHDFLGSMSHELRTPLTCVIGLSSTLLQWSSAEKRMPLSPEKQHEYLHLIQQSGRHLLALINNILEFSDVESGKHLLNIQQLSLRNLVQQSLYLLQDSAAQKDIVLSSEISIPLESDYFFADEIRLKEILFHILSNGIKFTPEGGKVILRVWREKHQVVIQVEDTGIGIASEEIPFLFEKFKQIENFRRRIHGGTGLGLALTKKLVELHGGTIEVESSLGKGAIFTVYLPEKTSLLQNLAKTSQLALGAIVSKTIVLITQDEAAATFICQLLNTIEYQVIWLMDSSLAVSQIELLQPGIIIVDQDYSSMEVINVLNALPHIPLPCPAKVVLLCDRLEQQRWVEYHQWGAEDYLLKAMNPTEIINKVNRLAGQKEEA